LPAALLALALAPWPYGYYQVLRIVVTGWAVFLAWDQYQQAKAWTMWVIGFAAIAVLFNPVAPIYLSRGTWAVLDLAGALAFAAFAVIAPKGSSRA